MTVNEKQTVINIVEEVLTEAKKEKAEILDRLGDLVLQVAINTEDRYIGDAMTERNRYMNNEVVGIMLYIEKLNSILGMLNSGVYDDIPLNIFADMFVMAINNEVGKTIITADMEVGYDSKLSVECKIMGKKSKFVRCL